MDKTHDLEIGLRRRVLAVTGPSEETEYLVGLRGSRPDSAADVRPEEGIACFPWGQLRRLEISASEYGQLLAKSLLADPKIQAAFSAAQASAEADQANLRLRLAINGDAFELHSLHWETLCTSQGSLLTTNEKLPFSRYLSSRDWRPVSLRARTLLRALIVISNPSDLENYSLAPVDVTGELERARDSLKGMALDTLASLDDSSIPSLKNIFDCLRATAYDLIYIVCHGRLVRGEPHLWLENERGQVDIVPGSELEARFRELETRKLPRLAVLASCQSAGQGSGPISSGGTDGDGVRVALGPRLVEAGIPAVVAMQGQISMETIARCMPIFFAELLKDGKIDRAIAVARGAVRERPDFWMPVLFMRLKDGMIWYEASFRDQSGRQVEFDKWPTLTSSIKNGRCTAIVGSGLFEPILGSLREIAQDWASTYAYPLSPDERDSLPQVSQYLGVDQDRVFLLDELASTLRRRLQVQFPDILAAQNQAADAPLDELIGVVGAELRKKNPLEPHRVLACLPLKVYVTTNLNSLISDALQEAGRQPVVEVLPWNDEMATQYQDNSIFVLEPTYRPSTERPLVYHLFGRFSQPESLVVTEDDHFDFLKGAARNSKLIPNFVQRAMADSALLFLGYQLEEWSFRVLFRSLLDQPGNRLYQYSHIAVQIMPEVGRLISTDRALRYLERYLNKGARAEISLYLGSAEEFVRLLAEKTGLVECYR
jgi:hypothetical protein